MKVDGKRLAFLCLFLWSLSPALAKGGVEGMGYLNFAFAVAVLAALFAFPLFLAERGWAAARKNWRQLLFLAFFAYALYALMYFMGFESISAVQGSALLGTEALFSLALSIAAGKEKADKRRAFFTMVLVLGVALAVMNGSFALGVGAGAVLVLGALLSLQIAFYGAPDAIRECGTGTILFAGLLFSALALALLFPLTGTALALGGAGMTWWVLAYAALPAFAAPVLWYGALKRISVYMATAIVVPAPALAFVFSALLLGEPVTAYHIAGIALITLSVWKITEIKATGQLKPAEKTL